MYVHIYEYMSVVLVSAGVNESAVVHITCLYRYT